MMMNNLLAYSSQQAAAQMFNGYGNIPLPSPTGSTQHQPVNVSLKSLPFYDVHASLVTPIPGVSVSGKKGVQKSEAHTTTGGGGGGGRSRSSKQSQRMMQRLMQQENNNQVRRVDNGFSN